MKVRFTFLAILMALFSFVSKAQVQNPAIWGAELSKKDLSVGDEIEVIFKAQIQAGWHVYSNDFDPNAGPVQVSFEFITNDSYELVGGVKPINAHKEFDKMWNADITYFETSAELRQKIKIKSLPLYIEGTLEYQGCNEGQCVLGDYDFKLGKKVSAKKENPGLKDNKDSKSSKSSLITLFILAFLGGLLAILTPCVFPMVPMTVTFFMHSDENKLKAKMNAMIYGLSIILIYTIIGTVVSVVFGASFANWLSTHWVPNTMFFLIFMIFAASFFGMFELRMPNSWVNASVKNEERSGVLGSVFMAFTLVLVSFSCTGPIVGAILVQSTQGEILMPIVGMLGFSLAFALPFTLFAIFPSWLNGLPKSGGWLNSVKVTLGFIELGLGLKFLSIVDQTYHLGILDREIYIAIWIVVATLMGLYFLGKIKFSHDSDVKFVSVPRLMLAIATFSFVVYLIPGMFGAPLKALSGYLPPMKGHDFDLISIVRENSGGTAVKKTKDVKYSDILELPHGLQGYFDYEEGIAAAKAENKPVFIDFTGHGCVNCREMEANVWSDPRVLKILNEEYVIIALYVDDKLKLPKEDWYVSKVDGKKKKTLGKQNADFQIERYKTNAQPYYCLIDNEGKDMVEPRAYDLDVDAFIQFLENGIKEFKKNN
ncbi:MAG: thioredoxin family protein [Marinifilaceae bacterium]|jgi:thiol:disulfide interchange protein DsbD|nr:thioredoxin family protein [Marinifilaceae bacterium]